MLRPLRFAAAGVLNTVLGLGVIFAAKAILGWADLPANILGYGIGLLVSFGLNRTWTFRHDGRLLPAFWRFGIGFAAAYAVNLLTLFALRDIFAVNSYVAQAAGVIPYTVAFYLIAALYVFPRAAGPGSGVDSTPANLRG
jgi:putative flippase GtrA